MVEAANAGESRCEGDVGDRECGFEEKLLCEEDALRACDTHGRRSQMFGEQAAEMTLADPDAGGEGVDGVVVQRPFGDQAQRARDRGRRSMPSRSVGRDLGPAPETRPESGLLRGGCTGEEHAVFLVRRWRGADGPAIDPSALDPREEGAVEAVVTGSNSAIKGGAI